MTKKTSPVPTANDNALPYVQIAAFCDMVLREGSGVVSAIRIVDVLRVRAASAEEAERQTIEVPAVIGLKSGNVKGQRTVRLFMTTPSGINAYKHEQVVEFVGEGHGITWYVTFGLQPSEEGLWWCEVQVDGTRVTRMPLRVEYLKPGDKSSEPVKPTN
jgi:hypothetical protein